MDPLRTSDPSVLAGHRLLGRLGAGGMGVVYLARSAGGSLVALKVIQAEYAEDAGFRERFRREAETARRMTSPWVASLVDADPDAPQPWLATAFVPGPSLGEAVAAHGPLPLRSVRVLGARLARALGDLHGVGLVHRDVKPGNVLLALDGPRLIDFGVARDPRDTGLTSTGVVVGTPGFLPPEQAHGTGELSASGDIFSLGCVLAFAATGRPPFGTGSLDALLYRTVHEAPDLAGVPVPLGEVVRGCLEKDPRRRPTAEALSATLDGAAYATPPDPREALRAVRHPAPPRDTDAPDADVPVTDVPGADVHDADVPVTDAPDTGGAPDGVCGGEREQAADGRLPADDAWLPEPLVRLIAERSAAGLALPAVDETEVDPASAGTAPPGTAPPGTAAARPAARTVGRRRFLLLTGGAAAVAAGGGLAAWAALDRDGGGEGDAGPVHTLGLHADLTGHQGAVGRAQERGLRLAVHEFNARADKPFTLVVKAVDDGGDPARAAEAAGQLVADRSVLAVIGPTTDATALASLAAYDAASLPLIAVTPGATALQVMGSRSFLHTRVTDTLLSLYLDVHLRGTAKSRTVGIVDDRAADAHAWEISSTLAAVLRKVPLPAVPKVVSALRTDFGPILDALLDGGADSVVFAGYHERAALLARELHRRGFPGARAAAQGVLDARFLSAAGDAADGWVIVAPAMDATVAPGAKAFRAAHRELFGAEPERYAVETYDVAQYAVKTLRSLSAGRRTRQALTTALRSGSHRGIARNLAFAKDTGALVADGSGVHLWKVEGGRFAYQGPAPYQVAT
ncbi:serine/threonine protein kinase [Streptomyces sp. WAC05374]|uniref:bifunctional serine/threonine-protein kinase/ABC transporter substrate-binding protein n=1 Tax=Streptomyces sp. WAC05374 TaxID=2487420 RepID=UPI000F892655|nr:bifunctional serine/threonine-protein kinase/ABC transporter substrate-binding protein [Streptomyces sp. WAC05374]RST19012.1 serine/threonine protein kinase [Streptomyces sp. WAC05374]TDF50586.1 serine/threonine protein kinase [Streptomyces sp. WAC05374]TDF56875.1 serine/threonine protein kinase [Streptomyces sp. WAC05374]TDF60838.1 serine/threonine protein kinase [Streptomyces sp. WAC05374]